MRTGVALWWCAGLLLVGCSRNSSQAPAVTHVAQVEKQAAPKSRQTPAEMTAGMVEAATVGKSTVPIGLKFDVTSRPVVDKPLDVVIAVMPQVAADPVILTVTDSGSMRVKAGESPIEIPEVDPTQVYRQVIQVTPTAEGVQLLAVSVALKHDEIVETRVFSMPIIVGAGADTAATIKH